jgi:SagB-type dehydrogenase family enzyme
MRIALIILTIIVTLAKVTGVTTDDYWETAQKADDLRAAGEFIKVAELYEAYTAEHGPDPIIYYSTACHWSLAGELDKAFTALSASIDNGLLEKEWIQQDEDFNNLREDPRYSELMSALDDKITHLVNDLPLQHDETDGIVLPDPRKDSKYSIEEVLENRRSIRSYTEDALTLEEVSQILWSAYGVNKPFPDVPRLRGGLKTAPSAGATYPLEIYLICGNVTNLEPGVYKYKPEDHSLVTLFKEDIREELHLAALQQPWVLEAPASLVYSALYSRTTDIYGNRGRDRYVCMDLGHSAENVYLQAGALQIGTVAIGAFSDLKVKLLVKMTRNEEPLYIMPLGKIE